MATLTFGPGEPDLGDALAAPVFLADFLARRRLAARAGALRDAQHALHGDRRGHCRRPADAGWRVARRSPSSALVLGGLAIDGWMDPLPMIPPPGRQLLANAPADAAILELPPDETSVSINAMYRALFHHRPVINGYSGHFPPHYRILSQALRRRDPSPIVELARGRPLVIFIDDRFDPSGQFRGSSRIAARDRDGRRRQRRLDVPLRRPGPREGRGMRHHRSLPSRRLCLGST